MNNTNDRVNVIEICGMLEDVIGELNEAYNLSGQNVQEIIGEQLEMLESVKERLLAGE